MSNVNRTELLARLDAILTVMERHTDRDARDIAESVSYTHLTLPTNREV